MSSSNLPPEVPTSFTTDDGVAIPENNNLFISAGDTTDNDPAGITTFVDPMATNTVQILLTNRVDSVAVNCPPNATTTLLSFDLGPVVAAYRVNCTSIGRQLGSFNILGYTLIGTFKTDGTTATRLNSPWKRSDEDVDKKQCFITLDVGTGLDQNKIILALHNDGAGVGNVIVSSLLEYIVVTL